MPKEKKITFKMADMRHGQGRLNHKMADMRHGRGRLNHWNNHSLERIFVNKPRMFKNLNNLRGKLA